MRASAATSTAVAARSRSAASRRLPRAQSLAVEPTEDRTVGDTGLGRLSVADSVVSKLAARAAVEVAGVGAAAPRLLGKAIEGGGLDRVGVRSSQLGALPAAKAQVDGRLAFVSLTVSVGYPAPVREVAAQVRRQIRRRVGDMTGLEVVEVDVHVPALLTERPRPARVR